MVMTIEFLERHEVRSRCSWQLAMRIPESGYLGMPMT
jgi:hypothetical protein